MRRRFVLVLVFVLTTSLVSALPGGAADGDGSISGVVTEDGATPIVGATVDLVDAGTQNPIASTATDATGAYSFVNVNDGSYLLKFSADGHATEWYDNQFSISYADVITVSAGAAVVDIDAALDLEGTITVTITEDGSPTPVNGVDVQVYRIDGAPTDYTVEEVGGGDYIVHRLAAGEYKLAFWKIGYAQEWYDDQLSFDSATPVLVATGSNSQIVVGLAQGGWVSGVVTDQISGLPISLVDVEVVDADSQSALGSATTDEFGAYTIAELPAGDVKTHYRDSSGSHLSEWYDSKPYFESATPIPITSGSGTTIDVSLSTGGWVTGNVVDGITAAALVGITVEVFDPTGTITIATESTDASGGYAVNVPPGDYIMSFSGDGLSYGTVWWQGVASQDQASEFTIASGDIHDANEQMWALGTISGSVVDGDDLPVEGVEVVIYSWDGDPGMGSQPVFLTDGTGAYTATGIPDGDYFVRFVAAGYDTQWFDGAPDMASAAVVTVTPPGEAITGIDATIHATVVPVSNDALPSVSGVTKVGKSLAGNAGSWSGTEPISYAYQWLRCDAGGSSCVAVSGATGLSYLLVSGDAGSTFVFEVEASNVVNSVTERSAATAVIQGTDPVDTPVSNDALPSVTGVTKVGESLAGNAGSWSGTEPISYAYQWLRCDAGGSSCVAVSGATGLSYLLVSGDAGSTFVFEVEASNVVNSVTERSAATAVIQAADVPPSAPPFKDTVGNIHLSAIEAIRAAGITKGCNPPANDMFCPASSVTRGQMAAFLNRAMSLPAADRDYFTDDDDSVFEDDINRVAAAGITKGCNPPANDHFCPTGTVSREQMAAFLTRMLDLPPADRDYFTDDDDSIFENDINRFATAGITRGCNPPANTKYCPLSPVRRDEMATFLTRALDLPTG